MRVFQNSSGPSSKKGQTEDTQDPADKEMKFCCCYLIQMKITCLCKHAFERITKYEFQIWLLVLYPNN